jgi:hypothetical protein
MYYVFDVWLLDWEVPDATKIFFNLESNESVSSSQVVHEEKGEFVIYVFPTYHTTLAST